MHILLAKSADLQHHEEWLNKMNNLKIPYEGPYRKGYCRPFIEEMKFYAIRIKKEAAPQFLELCGGQSLLDETHLMDLMKGLNGHEGLDDHGNGHYKNYNKTSWMKRFMLKTSMKLVRRLFRLLHLEPVIMPVPKPFIKGHSNTFIICQFKDPINKEKQEEL